MRIEYLPGIVPGDLINLKTKRFPSPETYLEKLKLGNISERLNAEYGFFTIMQIKMEGDDLELRNSNL